MALFIYTSTNSIFVVKTVRYVRPYKLVLNTAGEVINLKKYVFD